MEAKDEVKQRIDVVDLIGEYLELKPAGGGSFKALCPFHTEKTPSFHISREKQIWHCFGCGEGGDCFAFLMKMEGSDFPEALRNLAKRAGVEIPRFSSAQSNANQRLMDVNAFAAACYRKILSEASYAASARAYVEKRGITPELLEKFGIGYAPDEWDVLTRLLEKKGFHAPECEQAGLLLRRKSGPGHIDRFRNRLMIPLRDPQGNTVGFTGRLLPSAFADASHEGPKYMNSPETPIYKKGELLFGLDLARRAAKGQGSVVIVEGNLDVVASHKAGVEAVVASSGTALTERQLQLLKRVADDLVFAFDQDAAGFEAAKRGIQLARRLGFHVKVALLPPEAGKDPDEAVQKDPELWRKAVREPIPVMQYLIERTLRDKNLQEVDAKREAGAVLLPELALIENVIEREHWMQAIADALRTPVDALRTAVAGLAAGHPYGAGLRPAPAPAPTSGPAGPAAELAPRTRATAAAEAVLAYFLQFPDLQDRLVQEVTPAWMPSGDLADLYTLLSRDYTYKRFFPTPSSLSYFAWVSGNLSGDPSHVHLLPLLTRLGIHGETMAATLAPVGARQQLDEHIQVLGQAFRHARRKELEADIRRAEARGDREAVDTLLQTFDSFR
ncbi:DNA primase [Candidatus Uhrbacteria bacterium]|nr:DNA primase [Candidatus Uhrbacteria bacterium]